MYTKTSWVARVGTALNRFLFTDNGDGSMDLTADPTGITTNGTPISTANLNKIETGLADVHNPAFTEAGTLTNIATGEVVETLWGKVKKAIARVIVHDGWLNQSVKTTDSPEFANYASKRLVSGTDLNDVVKNGFYRCSEIHTNYPSGALNYGQLIVSKHADTISQQYFEYGLNGGFYWRSAAGVGGTPTWQPWKHINQSLDTGASPTFAGLTIGSWATKRLTFKSFPAKTSSSTYIDAMVVGEMRTNYFPYAQSNIYLPSGGSYYVAGQYSVSSTLYGAGTRDTNNPTGVFRFFSGGSVIANDVPYGAKVGYAKFVVIRIT